MKKIAAATLLALVAAGGVKASNYPPSYFYQTARVVSKGPAVVAKVTSGVMRKLVIGYKKSGILGAQDRINAVVRVTYLTNHDNTRTIEQVIPIEKEWHGTGFLTPSISYHYLAGASDVMEIQKIELAFFAGAQWDSNYSANYVVEKNEFENNAAIFRSEHSGGPDIDWYCWDFIVSQMRK